MIHLNVEAPDAGALADLWEHLRGQSCTVDIVDGELHLSVVLAGLDPATVQDYLDLIIEGENGPERVVVHPRYERGEPVAEVVLGADDGEFAVVATGTPAMDPPPASDGPWPPTADLRSWVLVLLGQRSQTAASLADATTYDVDDVAVVLGTLQEEGLVRRAGRAGWALMNGPARDPKGRLKSVDHDAARRRAAEAM